MSLRCIADDLADFASGKRSDLIRDLGQWLHDVGGVDLMNRVFDLAIDRRGYAALPGVNQAWRGIGTWELEVTSGGN